MENQIQNKKLEILVIEDDQNFMNVAKNAYMNDTNINPKFASTYEEAMQYLNDLKIDGVVSDLFFPSKIDWKNEYLKRVEEGANDYMKKFPKDDDEFHIKVRNETKKRVENYKEIKENPSGLGIIEYCETNKLPYIIVSQGDRHEGDLGVLRFALQRAKSVVIDKLPSILLYEGSNVSKHYKETWEDALKEVKNKIQGEKK